MNDKEAKAAAVGHIPSGLFVVCAKNSQTQKIDGFLGSWVQQVSFDPMLVMICIKSMRHSYESIANKEVFTINVVGDHNKTIMKPFWSGYDEKHNPFDEIPYLTTNEGGIVLENAKSALICKAVDIITPGDHNLVIAEVINSAVLNKESRPLTHIRENAFDY